MPCNIGTWLPIVIIMPVTMLSKGCFIAYGLPAAKKHSGAVTQFSLHFVKSGKIELTYGSFFARMMQLRQKADYNCAYDITEKDLREQVALSRDFIRKIEQLINDISV
jgi:uncharacterized protein (UPF0332 family)